MGEWAAASPWHLRVTAAQHISRANVVFVCSMQKEEEKKRKQQIEIIFQADLQVSGVSSNIHHISFRCSVHRAIRIDLCPTRFLLVSILNRRTLAVEKASLPIKCSCCCRVFWDAFLFTLVHGQFKSQMVAKDNERWVKRLVFFPENCRL